MLKDETHRSLTILMPPARHNSLYRRTEKPPNYLRCPVLNIAAGVGGAPTRRLTERAYARGPSNADKLRKTSKNPKIPLDTASYKLYYVN
jgi:hypothetical protein